MVSSKLYLQSLPFRWKAHTLSSSFDRALPLANMSARKNGTQDEVVLICRLLLRNAFKMDPKYRMTWTHMCQAARKDAQYDCTSTSKALRVTKMPGLQHLSTPDISSSAFRLPIQSLSFVATKMLKKFDVKLRRVGRRNLNVSHAKDFLSQLKYTPL